MLEGLSNAFSSIGAKVQSFFTGLLKSRVFKPQKADANDTSLKTAKIFTEMPRQEKVQENKGWYKTSNHTWQRDCSLFGKKFTLHFAFASNPILFG